MSEHKLMTEPGQTRFWLASGMMKHPREFKRSTVEEMAPTDSHFRDQVV